jgi:uncharacterized repeat protein (TIGR03803 family)
MKMHLGFLDLFTPAASARFPKDTWRELFNLSLVAALGLFYCVAVDVSKGQVTILHSFGDGTIRHDGALPGAGLILAPDGNFYGTTLIQDGTLNSGTVFQLKPSGELKIIHNFSRNSKSKPNAPLLYYNGKLIGTSPQPGFGRIFQTTPSVGIATLHVFGDLDGFLPYGGLIQGGDGKLYGTTFSGGKHVVGAIFKMSPISPYTLTDVYSFLHDGPESAPQTALLLAQDGKYYGTTAGNPGQGDNGTIFQMTPAGKVTFLYQFPTSTVPDAALIQGSDGTFYGTTSNGGQYGGGTVFSMTTTFTVTTLYSFPQGSLPGGLVFGPTGELYGTTSNGGTANRGTVYELSTDGTSYTVLHNFHDGSVPHDGKSPNGPLVVGADNNLYGTTVLGGTARRGTVFRISP